MKTSEKIELIKSGKYIIENDMKRSEEAKDILSKISICPWSADSHIYGLDIDGEFVGLTNSEANDRPRFKMSELVEVENECSMSGFGICPYQLKNGGCTFDSHCNYKIESPNQT